VFTPAPVNARLVEFYISDIFIHYLPVYMLPVYVNIACVYILCVLHTNIVIHVNNIYFAMFDSFITWEDARLAAGLQPDPLEKLTRVLHKPQAGFLVREERTEKEKGDKRRERGGQEGNFVGGQPCCKVRHCGRLSPRPAVFKLGSADQRGSTTGSHGVRERIPKSSNCLHSF